MRLLPLPSILLAAACGHAQYQGPESVEYDPVGDRYFVSNTGGSVIKVRDQAGNVVNWASVNPAPYGLEIMGEVLYACSGGSIKGYSLANASLVFNLNLGASFLNGITTDGQYLYATDFNGSQRKVYKVDVGASTFSVLVNNTGQQPNGIVWDPVAERLVVVFWGGNAPIKAYDRDTGAETVLMANSGLGNCDGVAIDCDGNFHVSSWSPVRITRFEPTFTQSGVNMNVPGLSNPADIDFDDVNDRLCIPNSGNSTVTLFGITCLTSAVGEGGQRTAVSARPNPADGWLWVDVEGPRRFQLIASGGKRCLEGSLLPGVPVDLSGLAPGVYALVLEGHAPQRVVVE